LHFPQLLVTFLPLTSESVGSGVAFHFSHLSACVDHACPNGDIMESSKSYRTSLLPDLSGRGATAAQALLVAGPIALLGASLAANLQATSNAEAALNRLAVPLMLAWAAALFLVIRTTAPVAAWTGLVAVTVQVTLVQEVSDGWLLLAVEAIGFTAFAVGLWRLLWVPKLVPVLLVAVPVVDALTPSQGSLLQLASVAAFVAVGLVLAACLRAGDDRTVIEEAPAWVGRGAPRVTVRSGTTSAEVPLNLRILPPQG